MDKQRLLELAGVPVTEAADDITKLERSLFLVGTMGRDLRTTKEQIEKDNGATIDQALTDAKKNLQAVRKSGKTWLGEGMAHLSELPENAEEAMKRAADIFEQAVDMSGIDQGNADEWADMLSDMMDAFHEELRSRGLYE